MNDARLHELARGWAANLRDPDKKQLRFNEIVEVARLFYRTDVEGGVRELVHSCDRSNASLYVKGRPMWETLRAHYGWMLA